MAQTWMARAYPEFSGTDGSGTGDVTQFHQESLQLRILSFRLCQILNLRMPLSPFFSGFLQLNNEHLTRPAQIRSRRQDIPASFSIANQFFIGHVL
jgi:hypothetical protein